ncbi:hypothetical protein LTR17_006464 [Elasticomyces elasticus]|nr:hypothetical protein LTR17_006464 [Elasticomyces elasticus]
MAQEERPNQFDDNIVLEETDKSAAAWSKAIASTNSSITSAASVAIVGAAIAARIFTQGSFAAIGQFLAGLELGKAAISGRLEQPYVWGTIDGKPATLVTMRFEFSSPRNYILEEARIEIEFDAGKNNLPRIRDRAPTELRSKNPTQVQISRGSSLAPNVNAGVGGGELGELHAEKAFSRAEGWSIVSNVGSSQGSTVERRVWWDLSANTSQRQGVKHHLLAAVIVEHDNVPFLATFKLSGRLHSWLPRFLRPEKEVVGRKVFPVQSGVNVLDGVKLERIVSENRQNVPGMFLRSVVMSRGNADSASSLIGFV